MTDATGDPNRPMTSRRRIRVLPLAALFMAIALLTFAVTAILVSIFEHRQEAETPFVRLVQVDETTTDPVSLGHQLAIAVRYLPPHGRRCGDAVRRLQRDAAEQAGRSSVAAAPLRRLCL